MRVEPEIPERENLTDRQFRAIFRDIKKAADRATDAILKAPKNARHEIAIEVQGIPRLRDRVAATYPEKGMQALILLAHFNCNLLNQSVERLLFTRAKVDESATEATRPYFWTLPNFSNG